MSVLKYLSAGKSLIGLKQTTVRYKLEQTGAFPKFDSKRNPFRPRNSRTTVMEASTMPGSVVENEIPAEPQIQAPTITLVNGPAPAMSAPPPSAAAEVSSRTVGQRAVSAFRQTVSKLKDVVGKVLHGIKGLAPWRRKKADPATLRFVKTPVQCELSLDAVKVVRNDLTDADFEVVPKSRKQMVGGESKTPLTDRELGVPPPGRLVPTANDASPMVEAGREG